MCELRREIVQRGLDLRKAKRQEETRRMAEAQAEAEAAEMRREINFHARFQQAEKKAAHASRCHAERQAERRAHHRAQDRKRGENWRTYLARNLLCVIVAGSADLLHALGGIHIAVALPVMLLALSYLFVNYRAFVTRNCKAENEKEIPA